MKPPFYADIIGQFNKKGTTENVRRQTRKNYDQLLHSFTGIEHVINILHTGLLYLGLL